MRYHTYDLYQSNLTIYNLIGKQMSKTNIYVATRQKSHFINWWQRLFT